MADVIKIKRSDATATPASLSAGELAYSEVSGNFFYGRISDGTPLVIGGKADHDKLAGIDAGAQVNTVDSVAGKTGVVTLVSTDITDFDTAADARIAASVLNDISNVSVAAPGDGQVLTYNNTSGNWEAQAAGSGVTTFVALNDTPANFTGSAGYFAKVNATADALEFVAAIDGGTY